MNIDEYQAKAILAEDAGAYRRATVRAADVFIAPDAATIGETMRRALLS